MKPTVQKLLLLICSFSLVACEDSMFLRSGSKMKEELQGTWRRNHLGQFPGSLCRTNPVDTTTVYFQEYWIFEGDKLFTVFDYGRTRACINSIDIGTPDLSVVFDSVTNFYNDFEPMDTNVVANFNVDADIFNAYLNLEIRSGNNINDQNLVLVPSWEFVELDGDVLYIAADNASGTSVLQKEFFKVK